MDTGIEMIDNRINIRVRETGAGVLVGGLKRKCVTVRKAEMREGRGK